MEVNIEQIMNEIRAEIKEKGYTSDILSFSDVTGKRGFNGTTAAAGDKELTEALDTANAICFVPFDRPLTGNPIVVFFKKVIRKLIRFYIQPTVEQQNEFNAQIINAVYTVGNYAAKKQADAEALSKKVEALEVKLETATKENEELRLRLERLEQAITEGNK